MVSEIPVCLPEEREFSRADVKITEFETKKEKKKCQRFSLFKEYEYKHLCFHDKPTYQRFRHPRGYPLVTFRREKNKFP